MKILVAVDGSPFSEAAVREVTTRTWSAGTEVEVLSVAHPLPFIPEPTFTGIAAHYQSLEDERRRSAENVAAAARAIGEKAPDLRVTTQVLDGSPKRVIVEEAERWQADLTIVGSHGYGPVKRFVLGSVAQAVAQHAHCSVEVVRSRDLLAASHQQ
jgi:nucleotide-binding universal stress UspA family protein